MLYKIIILRLPSDFLKKVKFLNLNTPLIKHIQRLAFPFPHFVPVAPENPKHGNQAKEAPQPLS